MEGGGGRGGGGFGEKKGPAKQQAGKQYFATMKARLEALLF